MIDHYRFNREKRSLEEVAVAHSDSQSPNEEASLHFDLEAMRDSLQSLSGDQRQVLILKYIARLPNEDIARIMNKKGRTIRALQMRGLQILASHVQHKKWA
jgi:RNA polymerase sigma factor (sigma-70 family)